MKKLYILPILFLLSGMAVYAQQEKEAHPSSVHGLIIGTNVVSLLEPDGGISLSLEHRFASGWSVLVEGTAIFIDNKDHFDLRGRYTPLAEGLRIRPEVRYYTPGKGRSYRLFFGQEFMYKQVAYNEEWITRISDSPTGYEGYEKIATYRKSKDIFGSAGKFGFQVYFDRHKKYMFELFVGVGLKYTNVKFTVQEPPAGSYLESYHYSWDEVRTGLNINVPMGLKLGYRF